MENFRENWKIYANKLLRNVNILTEILYLKKYNMEEFPNNSFLRMAKEELFAT